MAAPLPEPVSVQTVHMDPSEKEMGREATGVLSSVKEKERCLEIAHIDLLVKSVLWPNSHLTLFIGTLTNVSFPLLWEDVFRDAQIYSRKSSSKQAVICQIKRCCRGRLAGSQRVDHLSAAGFALFCVLYVAYAQQTKLPQQRQRSFIHTKVFVSFPPLSALSKSRMLLVRHRSWWTHSGEESKLISAPAKLSLV